MKIFLSWSGKRSRETAEILRDWIPQVIQAVEPWISRDIEKGKRWNKEISDNLEDCKVGIICLNRDNLHEDWLHFEAGALSKTKDAVVCTFLLDINPTDIEEPLAQFQHTLFSKDDVYKLIQSINNQLDLVKEKPLKEKVLIGVFETFWPNLEKGLLKIKTTGIESQKTPIRKDRELLEEILEIVRHDKKVVNDYARPGFPVYHLFVIFRGNENNYNRMLSTLVYNGYSVVDGNFTYSKKDDLLLANFRFDEKYDEKTLKAFLEKNKFVILDLYYHPIK